MSVAVFFFFFFWRTFFFVKRLWNHMKTKRLSRNGSFSSSIIFFLEVKMMSNCTNTKKISVTNFKYFMSKWDFFSFSTFSNSIFQIYTTKFQNLAMKYPVQVGNTVRKIPTKALGVWRRLWWWWKYDVRRILIREETTTTTNFREIR